MGRFTTFIGALILVVAACGGSASPAATPVPATATPVAATPVATTAAPATPAPTPAPTPIMASLTFDGKTCTYAGPRVVPLGATVAFTMTITPEERSASAGALLVVLPVVDGTTWNQILADVANGLKQSDVPAWAVIPGAGADGLAEVQSSYSSVTTVMTRNAYYVGCGNLESEGNKPYPAILLKVLKGG